MKTVQELRDKLPAKSRDELSFWEPIATNGFRGFSAEDFRQAAIHYKQYGLIQIGRDISNLEDKVVVELCCGPTAVVSSTRAERAFGVDPLVDVYAELWDLSRDRVEYLAHEVETVELPCQADIVICWNGIDHVRDLELAIARIRAILRDDGELWTFTNMEDTSSSAAYSRSDDPGHQHQYYFNERSLDWFFRSHGWRWVTKSRYQPVLGKVYPYAGLGGVLMKSEFENKPVSEFLRSIRYRVRTILG